MTQNSDIQQLAHQFTQYTNRNIFLTGKAGTGKTTFLQRLRESTEKQIAVVAPTGVAAINAGGTTIHSFFQLPLSPFIPSEAGRKDLIAKLKMQTQRREVIRSLELLVIDEVSMVRADVMDAIDCILRHLRYRHNEAFGGVQVVFIGDLYQLSPVAKADEWQILSSFYRSPYFFHSQVLLQEQVVYIEFEKIFRQQDMSFIRLLNEIRNNKLSEEGLQLLKSRHKPGFIAPKHESYITLSTHNYKADQINADELSALKGKTKTFKAKISGDFPEKSFPMEENLELKEGARVMFVKNDTETPRRFFNGKIGEITELNSESITVQCGDGENIEVKPMTWHNIRYTRNEKKLTIDEEILGSFTQFPLRLAWAITIHKSQGLTFDKAIIDAGEAFAPGQVYVALSRCRSLDGLVLLNEINKVSLESDQEIIRFSSKYAHSSVNLLQQLDLAKQNFQRSLLLSIFDFRTLQSMAQGWQKSCQDAASSFDADTAGFVQGIIKQINEIQQIGQKFQDQLIRISQTDELPIQERLEAAAAYFSEKLSVLSESINESSASTDSYQHAQHYDKSLKELFILTQQKKHLIAGIKDGFDTGTYFKLKNGFRTPVFRKSSYAKNNTQRAGSSHPQLLQQLFRLRNTLSEAGNLPIYLIAASSTLVEMAEYLPQNSKELLRIKGFGPVKTERYGADFLEVIADYCTQNGLESRIQEVKGNSKDPAAKPKRNPGETYRQSLAMFEAGQSIESIASERNLSINTVAGHLARFIRSGELDIKQLIEEERCRNALLLISEANKQTGSKYQALSKEFSNTEITLLLAWLNSPKKSAIT